MTQLKILNSLEQESFESPPQFNSVSRKKYLALPAGLRQSYQSLRKPSSRACLILVYGYFRAAKRFFGRSFVEKDILFVAKKLGCKRSEIKLASLQDGTYRKIRKTVLRHFGCREFDAEAKTIAAKEVRALVRSQLRPRLIIEQLIEVLIRRKIEVPSYGILSAIIATEINSHKRQMVKLTDSLLTRKAKRSLDRLINVNDTGPGKPSPYELTLLKKFSHSLQPAAIKSNVEQLLGLRELFLELRPVIDKLDLSREGIRYVATYVLKSPAWRLTAKEDRSRYLHLITFIVHQYYQLQDHLVDILLTSVRGAHNAALKEHKELCYKHRSQKHNSLISLVETVEELLNGYADIHRVTNKKGLVAERKVELIKRLLKDYESAIQNAKDRVNGLNDEAKSADVDFYAILESMSVKLQNRVAGIVKVLEFSPDCSDKALFRAIFHYKGNRGAITNAAPKDFLEDSLQSLLCDEYGKFRVSLYKVLLFTAMADAIRAGTLNLKHSYRYRTLEEYLIPEAIWTAQKEELLDRAGLQHVRSASGVLAELEQRLDQQYHLTNQNIQCGDNQYISLKKNGAFSLKTPPLSNSDTPGASFHFPDVNYVSLLEVLSTVNEVASFVSEFSNPKLKYNRAKPADRSYFAGLLGLGCGIGVRKIAQISRSIDQDELERAVNWHFSLENVEAANDKILAFMDKLELPLVYVQDKDSRHTSSDGQKVNVVVPSVGANHSFKYFGQGKGVSIYSFIDERHFLFHSTVFSAAEREAAYVIDGLMRNDVVQSDIHSTDTHGYSEVVFGATHLLGFMFAPRIKNLKRQRLYTFPGRARKDYLDEEYQILPDGVINTQLPIQNWDEILRFITTIKLKETAASQLFKRLNSYSKTHPLWAALKEFGRIVKSAFILRYIDDCMLRQSIEKQLNKVESAQRFSDAVAFDSQEFRQADREEQCITAACRRLIKNAIVCWNYLYLSQRIMNAGSEAERREIIEAVKNGSVVAWRHINFLGEYDFSDEKLRDSIGLILTSIRKLRIV